MSDDMRQLIQVLNQRHVWWFLEGLQKRGISVWVDEIGLKAGVDFLSKIGQAIIDAKVCIYLHVQQRPAT